MKADECLLKNKLMNEFENIKTVDCHSHTMSKKDYNKKGGVDLFSLDDYFGREIKSVFGIRAKSGSGAYEGLNNDEECWMRLKTTLDKSSNVTYWKHHILIYKEMFGLEEDELCDGNWRQLNESIKEKTSDPSWYDYVSRDLCKLETQVRNIPWFQDWDAEYFTAILRMDQALLLYDCKIVADLENYLGLSIGNLKDLKAALLRLVEQYTRRGAVGIKLAHAYFRTLHSENVDEKTASVIFDKVLKREELNANDIKQLQDYIIFYLASIANEMNLVFQIHTGVQRNWSNIPESNPVLLLPLLNAFPEAHFDLFHAGYPYSRELGMIGKHYPNVWLNMCWMYIISTAASRQILSEWLDLVPAYRILGFGSDANFPELVYGQLKMARSCIADVLVDKVGRDYMSEGEALSLGHKLLRDNGMELYKI